MIGDTLNDSKVRWAVQQASGELADAALRATDFEFIRELEMVRDRLRGAVERQEYREKEL